eukprot:IDg3212t1
MSSMNVTKYLAPPFDETEERNECDPYVYATIEDLSSILRAMQLRTVRNVQNVSEYACALYSIEEAPESMYSTSDE